MVFRVENAGNRRMRPTGSTRPSSPDASARTRPAARLKRSASRDSGLARSPHGRAIPAPAPRAPDRPSVPRVLPWAGSTNRGGERRLSRTSAASRLFQDSRSARLRRRRISMITATTKSQHPAAIQSFHQLVPSQAASTAKASRRSARPMPLSHLVTLACLDLHAPGRGTIENTEARRPRLSNPRRRLTHEELARDVTGYGDPTHKRCSNCSEWLPLEAFVANHRMYLGRSSWCRECARAATREWRVRNRERVNAERREAYRAEHPVVSKGCVVCGATFTGRPDRIVCSDGCRRARQREQAPAEEG